MKALYPDYNSLPNLIISGLTSSFQNVYDIHYVPPFPNNSKLRAESQLIKSILSKTKWKGELVLMDCYTM